MWVFCWFFCNVLAVGMGGDRFWGYQSYLEVETFELLVGKGDGIFTKIINHDYQEESAWG